MSHGRSLHLSERPGGPARQPSRRRGLTQLAARTATVLAAATVLAQIAYPLADGEPLRLLTIGTVLLFSLTSVLHAAVHHGPGWAAGLVLIAAGVALAAESVGVHTGLPFGRYTYAGTLGPQITDVPVVVPLAWLMMAYPCLLLGRRLARAAARRSRRPRPSQLTAVLTGAFALASWDLFLDSQMVAAGHWTWTQPHPALPGVPGVPVSNYLGWLAVSLLLVGLLHVCLPRHVGAPEGVPGALLTWTWAGSTLANAVFFARPWVALWGCLAMGAVLVPYLYSWWDDRP